MLTKKLSYVFVFVLLASLAFSSAASSPEKAKNNLKETALYNDDIADASSSDESAKIADYMELCDYALTTDTLEAESVAARLSDAFDADAYRLIKAMSNYAIGDIERLAYSLVYGKSYYDLYEFNSVVENMLISIDNTAEIVVLEVIIESIDDFINLNYNLPIEDPDSIKTCPFNKKTILGFIERNEKSGNVDEEYFHVLGDAYRADPYSFAEMISVRSDDSIDFIARAVAYDCLNHNDYTISSSAHNFSNENADSLLIGIVNLIEAEIADSSNGNLSSFIDTPNSAPVTLRSTIVPTIGAMNYTSAPLYVGDSEKLSVVFSESSSTSTTRTYYTEVYGIRNGTAWLKATKAITIPASSTSTTVTYNIDFSDVGEFYTLVKIYSSNGGSLLASRQGAYSDTIKGKWEIDISLKIDRSSGTLSIYNAKGDMLLSKPCLGRSASGIAWNSTNGHTPTGKCTGYIHEKLTPVSSYGPDEHIDLIPSSGNILISGRQGFAIHRGDLSSTGALRPTNGCVRLSNSSQRSLLDIVIDLKSSSGFHDSTGNIEISEYS
jgi:hypothetical protein